MSFANNKRITRRRSSAGPTPPKRPIGNNSEFIGRQAQGPRPTFLTLRDHGKVFVADLPNMSDGQLAHISKEANQVLDSLEKRLTDLENEPNISNPENDTLIKASTKRDVTLRFIKSIEEEQEHRKNNPALRDVLLYEMLHLNRYRELFLRLLDIDCREQLLIRYFERLSKLVQLMKVLKKIKFLMSLKKL